MKWLVHNVEFYAVAFDDETRKKWFAENELSHVIGTPVEVYYNFAGKKFVPMIKEKLHISHGAATVAACCGSMLLDCKIPKISDFWVRSVSQHIEIPLKKFVSKSDDYTKGITIYLNNKDTVPEKAETDKDVFDTFVFPDGDKITFQFRKVVEE